MSAWPVVPFLVPLTAAAVSAIARRQRHLQRAVSLAAALAALGAGAVMLGASGTSPARAVIGGAPARFAIVLVGDPFAALLVTVAGALAVGVLVFAVAGAEDHHPFLHPALLVFLAGACSSFLVADLFHLYVMLEVTLVASFVLATMDGTRRQVRAGAVYVVANLLGSLLLLTAVAWTYAAAGSVNLGVLASRASIVPRPVGMLLIVALAVKAAVVPVGGWLPVAYPVMPRSVVGLFAGLLTTVGVAAMYRVHNLVLHADPAFRTVLLVAAAVTVLVAAVAAVSRSSPEETLGFVIVAQVGFMLLGVGLAGGAALAAGIVFVVQDVLVKSAAFLGLGTARDILGEEPRRSVGTRRPVLAAATLVALFSLAGLPPTSGFVAKLLLVRSALLGAQPVIVAVALVASLLVLMALAMTWRRVFDIPEADARRQPAGPAPARLRLGRTTPVAGLVAITLLIGLQPVWLVAHAEQAATWLGERQRYAEAVLR